MAVIWTKHCMRGGNGDDFLSPCSSLNSNVPNMLVDFNMHYTLKKDLSDQRAVHSVK